MRPVFISRLSNIRGVADIFRPEKFRSRQTQVIALKSGLLEYFETGQGPTIMVLHGAWGGWDQGRWLSSALGLENYRLLCVSRPGYLKSPLISVKKETLLLQEFIKALAPQGVTLLAFSAGGMAGLDLASCSPNLLNGLIMVSAVSKPHARAVGLRQASNTALDNLSSYIGGLSSQRFTESFEFLRVSSNPRGRLQGSLADVRRMKNYHPPLSITVPLLVLHARNDLTVPYDHALHSSHLSLDSHLHTVHASNHHFALDNTSSHEHIEAFMKKIGENQYSL